MADQQYIGCFDRPKYVYHFFPLEIWETLEKLQEINFNSFPNNKVFDLSKLKAFADDNLVAFSSIRHCFQKASSLELLKPGIVW